MSSINKLPAAYQDLSNYNHSAGLTLYANGPSKEVTKKLSELQQEQNQLKSELARLRNKGAAGNNTPQPPQNTYQLSQAKTSAIFFAGGAPEPLPRKQLQTTSTKKSQASASSVIDQKSSNNSFASQNDQQGKLNFFSKKVDTSIYNKSTLQVPPSRYMLQAGTIIPAILQSTLVSNLPGSIVLE